MQAMTNHTIAVQTGKPKVEQYKWLMTKDCGELQYMSKNLLEIDHRYQRHAKNSRVLRLARRWNWLACGVLTIAKRDGHYYVIDGQHRLLAALKRSDIDDLPCLVFESTEMRDEAVAFRDANKERRPITTFEQWNAELVGKDEATLFVDHLIRETGRTPGGTAGPGTVRCLTAVVAAARTERSKLLQVWPVAMEVCYGNPLHERVFSALMYLQCNLVEDQSLADKSWRKKIVRLGYQGILEATHRASAFYSKGGAKVWALGVMQELNKGCRINRLSLRD
jgi:hypothetical protein